MSSTPGGLDCRLTDLPPQTSTASTDFCVNQPYLIHRLRGFVSVLNPTSFLPETFTRKHTETNTTEERPTDHRSPVPKHHTTRKKACSAQRGRCFICDRHINQHTQLPPFETAQSSQHGGVPQFKSTSVHPATNSHRGSPHVRRDVPACLLVRSPRSASEHSPWTKPIAVTLPSSLRDGCFASDPHPDTVRNR